MVDWFDYIFYRVTRFYKRRWKESFQESYGICALSIVQGMAIVDALLALKLAFGKVVFTYFPKPLYVAAIFAILGVNFYRYLRIIPYEKLEERWGNEDAITNRRRAVLVVLCIVVSISIPFAYGIIGHFSKHG